MVGTGDPTAEKLANFAQFTSTAPFPVEKMFEGTPLAHFSHMARDVHPDGFGTKHGNAFFVLRRGAASRLTIKTRSSASSSPGLSCLSSIPDYFCIFTRVI